MPAPQAVPPHSDVVAVPQSFRAPLVLSLFPGIGLMDRAFEGEGFCVVRGPDLLWGGDIRRFHPPAGRFDGVIGGPPCQAFSALAHLVRASGREPRFGNLIPEFERVVLEAQPEWFVMENVPAAPQPSIVDYGAHSFTFCNAALGEEQERLRRFTFGRRGGSAEDLRRWIRLAPLMLPRSGSVVTCPVNNDPTAKGRTRAHAVVSDLRVTPVAIGGSGKRKRTATVTSSDGGPNVRMTRYRFPEACRLQGLPEDFLADAPFTAEGKLRAVANGVPLPMGRAIAKAVKAALSQSHDRD